MNLSILNHFLARLWSRLANGMHFNLKHFFEMNLNPFYSCNNSLSFCALEKNVYINCVLMYELIEFISYTENKWINFNVSVMTFFDLYSKFDLQKLFILWEKTWLFALDGRNILKMVSPFGDLLLVLVGLRLTVKCTTGISAVKLYFYFILSYIILNLIPNWHHIFILNYAFHVTSLWLKWIQ